MGNVRVQLGTDKAASVSIGVAAVHAIGPWHMPVLVEARSAVVTETGAEVILLAAASAAVAELSAGHGEEEPIIPFDEFYVANDEGVIESQRAKGPQATTPTAVNPVGTPIGTPV